MNPSSTSESEDTNSNAVKDIYSKEYRPDTIAAAADDDDDESLHKSVVIVGNVQEEAEEIGYLNCGEGMEYSYSEEELNFYISFQY